MPAGRFAPSPTGELHFGSLLAAVASYCEARNKGYDWQLRIDDIDKPRSVKGSAQSIQSSLLKFGLRWDGEVRWQSHHHDRYLQALAGLVGQGLIFSCGCSRKSLPPSGVYPGTCRSNRLLSVDAPVIDRALRLVVPQHLEFVDRVQGVQAIDLAREVGDSVIWRRDQLVSYTLACAVDDAEDCTEVVRGADLLPHTAVQIAIMNYLSLPVPQYAHIPVALNHDGDKLSKHSQAQSIDSMDPVGTLHRAWQFLGQAPIAANNVDAFWTKAVPAWQLASVPKKLAMAEALQQSRD